MVVRADGGKRQTTYKGMPLYFFCKDVKPGDTAGQGFKDIWSVVKPYDVQDGENPSLLKLGMKAAWSEADAESPLLDRKTRALARV